jgi:hypothetical protein
MKEDRRGNGMNPGVRQGGEGRESGMEGSDGRDGRSRRRESGLRSS